MTTLKKLTDNALVEMPVAELADALRNYEEYTPPTVSFAAEAFGQRCLDSNTVREVLLPLLKHPSAGVREGTLYGLNGHHDPEVLTIVAMLAVTDPSNAIRTVAEEYLENAADEDFINEEQHQEERFPW